MLLYCSYAAIDSAPAAVRSGWHPDAEPHEAGRGHPAVRRPPADHADPHLALLRYRHGGLARAAAGAAERRARGPGGGDHQAHATPDAVLGEIFRPPPINRTLGDLFSAMLKATPPKKTPAEEFAEWLLGGAARCRRRPSYRPITR